MSEGVYNSKIKLDGSWQGAPRGIIEPMASVGDFKLKKSEKKPLKFKKWLQRKENKPS